MDDKAGSTLVGEFSLQLTAVKFHDLTANIQTEAHAAYIFDLVRTVKTLEEFLTMLRGHTHAVIGNCHTDRIRFNSCHHNFNRAAIRAVFDGVVEQVGHHLLKSHRVDV